MFNLLKKGFVINNIVETLRNDPENGVIKLLETAKTHTKNVADRELISQVVNYYSTSQTAKMQIKNLVYNTNKIILQSFADKVYESLQPPISIDFLKMITIDHAAEMKFIQPSFNVIDIKNVNEATLEVLNKFKSNGQIYFVSIAATIENFDIVTSDEVILTLIRHGARAIFYRMPTPTEQLDQKLIAKIEKIRTARPILAFLIKKDLKNNLPMSYVIYEKVNNKHYQLKLDLR